MSIDKFSMNDDIWFQSGTLDSASVRIISTGGIWVKKLSVHLENFVNFVNGLKHGNLYICILKYNILLVHSIFCVSVVSVLSICLVGKYYNSLFNFRYVWLIIS